MIKTVEPYLRETVECENCRYENPFTLCERAARNTLDKPCQFYSGRRIKQRLYPPEGYVPVSEGYIYVLGMQDIFWKYAVSVPIDGLDMEVYYVLPWVKKILSTLTARGCLNKHEVLQLLRLGPGQELDIKLEVSKCK